MLNVKRYIAAAAIALVVTASGLAGIIGAGTAHADCSPLLRYCLNESALKIEDSGLTIVENPSIIGINLRPSAEISDPRDSEVFYVQNSYDSVQIDVEGRGNGVNGFYTSFDSTMGTGLWWRAFSGQVNYDYAQGAQDTMTLHAGQYGCRSYVVNLQVWENFTTMAEDWHGILVCVQ